VHRHELEPAERELIGNRGAGDDSDPIAKRRAVDPAPRRPYALQRRVQRTAADLELEIPQSLEIAGWLIRRASAACAKLLVRTTVANRRSGCRVKGTTSLYRPGSKIYYPTIAL